VKLAILLSLTVELKSVHPFRTCVQHVSPCSYPQNNQSAGPVRFLIFCWISIFLLASPVAGRRPQYTAVQIIRECTPPYLSTGISNLLQPAQAEVVFGQHSTYLASWFLPKPHTPNLYWYCTYFRQPVHRSFLIHCCWNTLEKRDTDHFWSTAVGIQLKKVPCFSAE
jgi:hypothetical protein